MRTRKWSSAVLAGTIVAAGLAPLPSDAALAVNPTASIDVRNGGLDEEFPQPPRPRDQLPDDLEE